MTTKSRIVLAVAAGAMLVLPVTRFVAMAADVPNALAVEWAGEKPCEKLFEDDQIRVARCTFAKGAMHLCHSHPSYFSYVLSGGQAQVQDEKGIRKIDVIAGTFTDIPPIQWHELSNIGETTLQYLVVEKKYQPVATAVRSFVRLTRSRDLAHSKDGCPPNGAPPLSAPLF
jgi:beta-alanine degradation protein BauB